MRSLILFILILNLFGCSQIRLSQDKSTARSLASFDDFKTLPLGLGVYKQSLNGREQLRAQCISGETVITPYLRSYYSTDNDLHLSQLTELFEKNLLREENELSPEKSFLDTAKACKGNFTSRSFSIISYENKLERLTKIKRNELGKEATINGEWENTCGNNAIIQRNLGYRVYLHLHLENEGMSQEQQLECFRDLNNRELLIRPFSLEKLNWKSQVVNKACEKGIFKIDVLQQGGNIDKFPATFSYTAIQGNTFHMATQCPVSNPEVCKKADQQLKKYIHDKDGFVSTINNDAGAEQLGGPAVLQYILQSTSEL